MFCHVFLLRAFLFAYVVRAYVVLFYFVCAALGAHTISFTEGIFVQQWCLRGVVLDIG